MQVLKTLRNFYFISSHLGTDTLSQHSFVYLTAVDIISQYPKFAEALVNQLRPAQIGLIPQNPLDRCLDIYFLNTAEHFATVLNTKIADGLLLSAAMPYLGTNDERKSLEAFEAAHSVMIAVMAAPHNNDLTVSRIETYAGRLFEVCQMNPSIGGNVTNRSGFPAIVIAATVSSSSYAARANSLSTFTGIGAAAITSFYPSRNYTLPCRDCIVTTTNQLIKEWRR